MNRKANSTIKVAAVQRPFASVSTTATHACNPLISTETVGASASERSTVAPSEETESTNSESWLRSRSSTKSSESVANPNWSLVSHHRLPLYLQDNEFIVRHYRPHLRSFWLLFLSAFKLHSETVNVWSHILGAVGCLFLMIYDFSSTELTLWEKIWFVPFFLASIFCLSASGAFHLFYPYSSRVSHVLSRLDYTGIIVLTVASFLPWINYAFICHPYLQVYYSIQNVVLGTGCIATIMNKNFHTIEFRTVRAVMFAGFGLTAILPTMHYYYLVAQTEHHVKMLGYGTWLVATAGFYLFGALMYAVRIPERFWPGTFDLFGHSHQILHFSVLLGFYSCYTGINELVAHTCDQSFSCYLEAPPT